MTHSQKDPATDGRAREVRLRKIIGQLKGVEKMVAGEYDCSEVLNQLVSARRGLKSLAEKIINDHLQNCLENSVSAEKRRRQLREVTTMLKRYVD